MCIRDSHQVDLASGEKRQTLVVDRRRDKGFPLQVLGIAYGCLLYTSDAADERSSVDLGGRRIIKKKKQNRNKTSRDMRLHVSSILSD